MTGSRWIGRGLRPRSTGISPRAGRTVERRDPGYGEYTHGSKRSRRRALRAVEAASRSRACLPSSPGVVTTGSPSVGGDDPDARSRTRAGTPTETLRRRRLADRARAGAAAGSQGDDGDARGGDDPQTAYRRTPFGRNVAAGSVGGTITDSPLPVGSDVRSPQSTARCPPRPRALPADRHAPTTARGDTTSACARTDAVRTGCPRHARSSARVASRSGERVAPAGASPTISVER
jgi:hypothetical protein